MDISLKIKQQKSGIVLHRMVYLFFVLIRLFMAMQKDEISSTDNLLIVLFVSLCLILEEVFYFFDYFNNVILIRVFRYIQCLLAIAMLCFTQSSSISNISVFALLMLFTIDLFITMNIVDVAGVVSYMFYLLIPLVIALMVKILSLDMNHWVILVLNVGLVLLVIYSEATSLIEYIDVIEKKLFNQQNEISDMQKKNAEIVGIQNKLQDTNYALNTQKNDLKNANKQIREANAEMAAQTDVLHYIVMSFDVEKISRQILDAIMEVKGLDFCAVYILKNVYRNKQENYIINAEDESLKEALYEHISDIYDEMVHSNKNEVVLHEEVKEYFKEFKMMNIRTAYIKVLGLENDTYGLFMIGDKRPNIFDDKMSFYEAIIAQYDIAISNAKIYSDMQYMAQKDGLTGINNRIHFNELFKKEATRVVRDNSCVSVALFDVDKFKNVNDTYGHLAGDEVIKRIASVTEACIDQHDGFICRYGGEEFVVVLPDKDIKTAKPIIESLFESLCEQVVHFNEYHIPMSVSVGLTSYPEVCDNTEELLKRADWCMYYAKEHGRHQIKIDDGNIQRD